ncbi:MAG: hypothetical protein CNE38_00865 [Rhodothermaeota bacterium MED-G12]|nr:MAG: hypothetical protein CNE38_00865 [Rhodothermaeota bacterium MED-G12]|tara:strand:- start:3759 stop:5519 length:1761 start_codon:yes stop_codon:yes gene_type:complete
MSFKVKLVSTVIHLIFTAVILTNCSNIQHREADIVASVKGIGDISFNELQNHYRDYQFDLKYRDNPKQGYQEALQSLVLFKRKVADFKKEEMYENKKLMNPIQRYVNEEIRRLYFEEEYLGKYINEASITSYYQLMNKEITYQQLVLNKFHNQNSNSETNVKSRIDQILSEINSGTDFDILVSRYSEDITNNNNGLMPPINWRNGWLNSTNRAISSMNIGDIEVLESESMYYIIKISDIKIVDIPQLNDIRPTIIKNLREQYLDRALQEFAFMEDNIVDTKDFKWNEEAVKEITNWSKDDSFFLGRYKDTINEAINLSNNKTIISNNLEEIKYDDLLYFLNDILIPGIEKDISENDLKNYIVEAIRTDLIIKKAKDLGYDEKILTGNATDALEFQYQKIYTIENVDNKIPTANDTFLKEFYNEHKDSLLYQYALTSIYVKLFYEKSEALKMIENINAGESFEQAANRTYKVKSFIKNKEGKISSYYSKEEPILGNIAFEMEPNEIIGPINTYELGIQKFAVIKSSRKIEEKVPTFNEIENLEKLFEAYYREQLNQRVKDVLASKYPVITFDDIISKNIKNGIYDKQ